MAITNLLYFPAITARIAQVATAQVSAGAASATAAHADTYSSGPRENLGIMTPQQALAMKAQSKPAFTDKDLMGAITAKDYGKLADQMGSVKKKAEFLAKFHKDHPAEYAALLSDIRLGAVADPTIKAGVALETMRGTKWAKSGEGARIAAHLSNLYNQGKLKDADDLGNALGVTNNTGEGTGRDGSKVENEVVLRSSLLNSPEAAAAILAHEGSHSYRAANGKMKRTLHEEVDAHAAQNAVWKDLGKEKYVGLGASNSISLDGTAEYDTTEKLYNHLTATYVHEYQKAGKKGDKGANAVARGIILDYAEYSKAHKYTPSGNIHDEDLQSLLDDARSLKTKGSSEKYLAAVRGLEFESNKRKQADAE